MCIRDSEHAANLRRLGRHGAPQQFAVAHIAVKGDLLADRFAFVFGDHRAVVQPTRMAGKIVAVFAKAAHQLGLRLRSQVANGKDCLLYTSGSPTYAVRHLQGSLIWETARACHRLGAALILSSACLLYTSRCV